MAGITNKNTPSAFNASFHLLLPDRRIKAAGYDIFERFLLRDLVVGEVFFQPVYDRFSLYRPSGDLAECRGKQNIF